MFWFCSHHSSTVYIHINMNLSRSLYDLSFCLCIFYIFIYLSFSNYASFSQLNSLLLVSSIPIGIFLMGQFHSITNLFLPFYTWLGSAFACLLDKFYWRSFPLSIYIYFLSLSLLSCYFYPPLANNDQLPLLLSGLKVSSRVAGQVRGWHDLYLGQERGILLRPFGRLCQWLSQGQGPSHLCLLYI